MTSSVLPHVLVSPCTEIKWPPQLFHRSHYGFSIHASSSRARGTDHLHNDVNVLLMFLEAEVVGGAHGDRGGWISDLDSPRAARPD
jgi:hypothetical protein